MTFALATPPQIELNSPELDSSLSQTGFAQPVALQPPPYEREAGQSLARSNGTNSRTRYLSDEQIVERVKRGDLSSFGLLVRRHEVRAMQVARTLVRDDTDANDIVQDAFVRAFCRLSDFEGGSAFYTWFYRIIHNLCVDTLRRPYRRRTQIDRLESILGEFAAVALPNTVVQSPDEFVRRSEIAVRIGDAMRRLSQPHREVFLLREILGMSYAEIAVQLGCAKGTVMSRLFHSRQHLQLLLRDLYDEEFSPS